MAQFSQENGDRTRKREGCSTTHPLHMAHLLTKLVSPETYQNGNGREASFHPPHVCSNLLSVATCLFCYKHAEVAIKSSIEFHSVPF